MKFYIFKEKNQHFMVYSYGVIWDTRVNFIYSIPISQTLEIQIFINGEYLFAYYLKALVTKKRFGY